MGIGVLGPVTIDGAPAISRRDRIVLSVLVVRRDEVITPDQVSQALWPDGEPDSWRKVVQGSITRLRKVLGRDSIETTPGGYRLRVGPDDVDAWRFQRLVDRAAGFSETNEHDRACDELAQAISLWRGEPFAELDGWAAGAAEATRMLELRRFAEERHAEARLALGDHRAVAAELRALVAAEPLREKRWALLATGLYRSGRQGDALRALHDARRVLTSELGVAPSAELVDLEQAILRQDADLDAPLALVVASRVECPYKGLEAYREDDTELFFGRDDEADECCRRVVESGFLAVIGASGSGKSSLARAGIVPRLRALGRRVAVCTPGVDPHAAFAAARAAVGSEGVVVVDQGEELFTVCTNTDRREAFVRVLTEHARSGGAVVCTLRADYITDVASYPELARLIERSVYLLGPMGETALRSAIDGPARVAGLRLESGLVDVLVYDVVDQPGVLPSSRTHWSRPGANARAGCSPSPPTATVAGCAAPSHAPPSRSTTRYRNGSGARCGRCSCGSSRCSATAKRCGTGSSGRCSPTSRTTSSTCWCRRGCSRPTRARSRSRTRPSRGAWPRLQRWLEEDSEGQRVLSHLSAASRDWAARGCDADDLYRGAAPARRRGVGATARGRSVGDGTRVFLEASAAERGEPGGRGRCPAARSGANQSPPWSSAARGRAPLGARARNHLDRRPAGAPRIAATRPGRHRVARLRAQSVVSQSAALQSTKRDLSALLALEAYRLQPNPKTESAVLSTFTGSPGFLGYLRGEGQFWSSALDTDGGRLIVSDSASVLRTYDINHMSATRTISAARRPQGFGMIATTGDGNVVVVVSNTGPDGTTGAELSAYDTRTGRARFQGVAMNFPTGSIAISPDDALVAVGGGKESDVEVHDRATGAFVSRLPRPPADKSPYTFDTAPLAFASATRAVVGSNSGVIRVVDPRNAKVIRSIDARVAPAEGALHVSPDGTHALARGRRADDAVGPRDGVGELVATVDRGLHPSRPGVPVRNRAVRGSVRSGARHRSRNRCRDGAPVRLSAGSRRAALRQRRRPHPRGGRRVEHRVVAPRRFGSDHACHRTPG